MRRAISWFPLFFLPGLHMAVRHAPRAWQFATSASERALSYEGHSSPAQPSEASAPVRRRRVRWGGPMSARSSGQGPPQRTARPFHTRRRTPGAWVAILCSHPSCSTRARRTSESLLSRPWRLAIGRVLATRPWRTVLTEFSRSCPPVVFVSFTSPRAPCTSMSDSFLAAAEDRFTASALLAAFTNPAVPAASPLALMMRADLAASRLTPAEYVREARAAGVSLLEITATLKSHMSAQKSTDKPDAATVEDVVLPAGTYYGRKHSTPVRVVDGIFVPVTPTGPAATSAVATSLAWLREHGGAWGGRAAERLGPENDFMPDLELIAARLAESVEWRLGGATACRPTPRLWAALQDRWRAALAAQTPGAASGARVEYTGLKAATHTGMTSAPIGPPPGFPRAQAARVVCTPERNLGRAGASGHAAPPASERAQLRGQ